MILSMVSNPGARAACHRFKRLFDVGKKMRAKLWFEWKKFNVVACAAPSVKNQRGERIAIDSVGATTVRTLNGRAITFTKTGYSIEGNDSVVFANYTITSVKVGTAAMVISFMPVDVYAENFRTVYVNVVTDKESDLAVVPGAIDPADDNLLYTGIYSITKDTPDGASVWQFDTDHGTSSISTVAAGFGHVIVGMYGPDIYDLDSATGKLLHKYTIGDSVSTIALHPLGCIATDHESTTVWHLHDKKVRAIANPRRVIKKAVTTRTGMVCFQLLRGPVENQWYTLS